MKFLAVIMSFSKMWGVPKTQDITRHTCTAPNVRFAKQIMRLAQVVRAPSLKRRVGEAIPHSVIEIACQRHASQSSGVALLAMTEG